MEHVGKHLGFVSYTDLDNGSVVFSSLQSHAGLLLCHSLNCDEA